MRIELITQFLDKGQPLSSNALHGDSSELQNQWLLVVLKIIVPGFSCHSSSDRVLIFFPVMFLNVLKRNIPLKCAQRPLISPGTNHKGRRMGPLGRPPGSTCKGGGAEGLTARWPPTEVGSLPTAPTPQDPQCKERGAQPPFISF